MRDVSVLWAEYGHNPAIFSFSFIFGNLAFISNYLDERVSVESLARESLVIA